MYTMLKTVVAVDMDGTLIRNTNSMELVGGLNGHAEEINEVFARIRGEEHLNWVEGDAIMAGFMRGVREDEIDAWFETHAKVIDGLDTLLNTLDQNGIDVILITSGPKEVAECLGRRYPFKAVYGSEYEKKNGVLTGKIAKHIMDHGGKYGCLESYCSEMGADPSLAIAIGDSYSDIEVFQKCSHSIALNGEGELRQYADREFQTEDIRNLLPQILLWRSEQ